MIVIEGINHIGISSSNLDQSINFYKDMFDFELLDKLSGPGEAVMKMNEILITLYEVEGYKGQEDSKNCISFYVDEEDFEDALEEISENEIEIVYGPENIRNGKTVVFLDPDNNRIELSYPSYT
ncbi:VOC family protein [Spirochaetota bacterium]